MNDDLEHLGGDIPEYGLVGCYAPNLEIRRQPLLHFSVLCEHNPLRVQIAHGNTHIAAKFPVQLPKEAGYSGDALLNTLPPPEAAVRLFGERVILEKCDQHVFGYAEYMSGAEFLIVINQDIVQHCADKVHFGPGVAGQWDADTFFIGIDIVMKAGEMNNHIVLVLQHNE